MKINITIGSGFLGMLTLIFVIAKLWDKVDWSWWFVFAPLWVPVALAIIFFLIGICLLILYLISEYFRRRY